MQALLVVRQWGGRVNTLDQGTPHIHCTRTMELTANAPSPL